MNFEHRKKVVPVTSPHSLCVHMFHTYIHTEYGVHTLVDPLTNNVEYLPPPRKRFRFRFRPWIHT